MTTKVQNISWHANRWSITQSTYSWPEVGLFSYHLATIIVDIKQTGDLLYFTPRGTEDTERRVVMETDPWVAVRIV